MTATETRPDVGTGTRERVTGASRRRAAQLGPVVGQEPRVDLLPGEVHVERRERGLARRAWLGVVVAGAVVVFATGGALAHQITTASSLTAASGETTNLLAQQQRFAEVRQAEQDTQLLEAAQAVGGSTEIDWDATLAGVRDALPDGLAISGMTIASANVVEPFTQSTAALQRSRVATLTLTIKSTTIPSVPDLTSGLSALRGYQDSAISSISFDKDKSEYTSVIDLQLDDEAYDGKYMKDADR